MEPMTVTLQRLFIPGNGFTVPAVVLTPEESYGCAVVVPGYGGDKEEILGLSWRIAEAGVTAYAIDLRGHGEHSLSLDEAISDDVEAAIRFCGTDRVAAIGHSLGGRLALLSSAAYAIGISPALNRIFSRQTQAAIAAMRGHRVRTKQAELIFGILGSLPEWKPDDGKQSSIIFGSRDIPDIITACGGLKEKGSDVTRIENAMHGDIFQQEETFGIVTDRLKEWFSIP